MVKESHGNSILYHDASYKMAKKLGLSDGRLVKKYINRCIAEELCSVHKQSYNSNDHRTIYKFISYEKALTTLLGITKNQYRYFPLHRDSGKFKNYQYKIEQDLIGKNFSQQAYKANSNYPNKKNIIKQINLIQKEINRIQNLPVSDRCNKGNRSKKARLITKFAKADVQIESSRLMKHVDGVVTGCRHLGKHIGKSHTTAFNRFKKWRDEGTLLVHDIVYFQPSKSIHEAYLLIDSMKESRSKGVHIYSKKEGGIKTIMGKRVLGFKSERFSYGELEESTTMD